MSSWQPVVGETFQWARLFNDHAVWLERANRDAFPKLRGTGQFVVFSDFSAHPSGARRDVLSFLFTNDVFWRRWNTIRGAWRAESSLDTRRMKFSNLNDGKRAAALTSFLATANSLNGLLATFVIDSSVQSLFAQPGQLKADLGFVDDDPLNVKVVERMLRAATIVAAVACGLSDPGQQVLWICDDDDILANEAWQTITSQVAEGIFADASRRPRQLLCLPVSTPLPERLAHEDSCSITDLVVGAVGEFAISGFAPVVQDGVYTRPPPRLSLKTRRIVEWLAADDQPLKRLVCRTHQDLDGNLLMSGLRFVRGPDLNGGQRA
ncbi:hypothetical protein J0H33_14665 [bacterium]|nr:hypothetical protein [bacterium]